MRFIRPRYVFLFYMTMCWVFISPAITAPGYAGMSMLYVTLFFESIIFPTIVALGMRGLGKYSKRGSGFIVGGVCGGKYQTVPGAASGCWTSANLLSITFQVR